MDKKYFKKSFGQNFLINEDIIKKIISTADIKDKKVIEIGPGKGALTKYLSTQASELICYEIDKNLVPFLKQRYETKTTKIIEANFLEQNLNQFRDWALVANIPYNITSSIIFKIINNYKSFQKALLMVQKEIAQRLCSKINDSNYGKLAVSLSYFYQVKICFDVFNKNFYPSPKVNSSIISLTRNDNIDPVVLNDDFLKFILKVFAFRRKTLINNLKLFFASKKIINYLLSINKKIDTRAQELSPQEILDLYKFLLD